MSVIKIASRKSRLAVIQTKIVQDFLESKGIESEIVGITTKGDVILDRPLDKIGGKGLFIKELEQSMSSGGSDLAVHSLKDMPMEINSELPIIGFSGREDPRDVLVLPKGQTEPDKSKPIGCSGIRRTIQAKRLFPDMEFACIRGNVDTRLRKLDEGQYSALILAAAGLKRMGLAERISRYFDVDEIVPSAGQGTLAVQGIAGRDYSFLDGFFDNSARVASLCERAFVRKLGGDCTQPIAAYAAFFDDCIHVTGMYGEDEDKYVTMSIKSGKIGLEDLDAADKKAEDLGTKLAADIREKYAERYGKNGKVMIVGAGPSDAGLMTIKGLRALKLAHIVVYDALVGDEIISLIPSTARKIYVGKRIGSHSMAQEEINDILVSYARQGLLVVRLKGGDPFLFGRGGEEAKALSDNNIPYEIVPGVTSALAVPAYNGIPVTHRDLSSSLHIITGHKKNGGYDIDFKALVKAGGTCIFLMGVTALGFICRELINAGMRRDTPAALLVKGTKASHRKVVSDLENLETAADALPKKDKTPGIIVVGDVCTLSDELDWYGKLPLCSTTVIVTRPEGRQKELSEKLSELGAHVVHIPAIKTVPIEDNIPLRTEISQIKNYSWLVYTSPFGVDTFFDECRNMEFDIRNLWGIKIAAIGPKTADKLRERGIYPDLVPDKEYCVRELGERLKKILSPGDKVLVPRAKCGSEELTQLITESGAQFSDIPSYDTVYLSDYADYAKRIIDEEERVIVTFTSASTVRAFAAALGLDYDFTKINAACIGAQTMGEAKKYGMRTVTAKMAGMDELVTAIKNFSQKGDIDGK